MRIDLNNLEQFSMFLHEIQKKIGFKVSSRGWAYLLETERLINKDEFDRVTNIINKCRKKGYLPIDFTAEESARRFHGVEKPNELDIVEDFGDWLKAAFHAADNYTPDWFDGEEYYIQMVVEKVDLVTLFQPICNEYHIPIANSKGWSSMLQRAEYARRFAEARDKGLKPVLLYCGDFDPDGLRISEFIRKNLDDLKNVVWDDGMDGYDPKDLIIDRFGLNYDFIIDNNLTWIDNLITGSKLNLADPNHKNHNMPYIQEYLKNYGVRKCEANAIVVLPKIAKNLVREAIEKYLGKNAKERFYNKIWQVKTELNNFLESTGTNDLLDQIFLNIENWYYE